MTKLSEGAGAAVFAKGWFQAARLFQRAALADLAVGVHARQRAFMGPGERRAGVIDDEHAVH